MTDIRLEPIPTAFAPSPEPLSLATPSCCCCCCCLNTIAGVTAFTAAEAAEAARENDASGGGTLVAFLAVPATIAAATVTGSAGADEGAVVVAAAITFIAFFWGGLALSGVPPLRGFVTSAVTGAVGSGLLVAELFVTLATAFLIQLAFPFAIWAAIAIARSRHETTPTLSPPPTTPGPPTQQPPTTPGPPTRRPPTQQPPPPSGPPMFPRPSSEDQ